MDSSKLICVIEDNTPIRKLFCTLLRKSGYNTIDFEDGSSALEWMKDNHPNLILMDILLPDLNGTELIGLVRAIDGYASTPIIAVTGFAGNQDRTKFLEIGFNGYISKPINTSSFVSDVEQFLA